MRFANLARQQQPSENLLTPQQRSIESTAAEVARRCRERQLSVPHPGTIRARIVALPLRERLSRRSHRKAAVDRFALRPGAIDEAQRPLTLFLAPFGRQQERAREIARLFFFA